MGLHECLSGLQFVESPLRLRDELKVLWLCSQIGVVPLKACLIGLTGVGVPLHDSQSESL